MWREYTERNGSVIRTVNATEIPAIRHGAVYESMDRHAAIDHQTDRVVAHVSRANAGLIRKDLRKRGELRNPLLDFTCKHLLEICQRAAVIFMNEEVPLDDKGTAQSIQDYIQALSATSGLPHTLCRANMEKIENVFSHMPKILNGLMRGLDLAVLDTGVATQSGTAVSYYPVGNSLGVVLPSNSPGVNSIWMPAIPLKIPVVLKPGRDDPWTPYRIVRSFVAAGCPAEAFCIYPCDHEGANAILNGCDRSLIFGDEKTTAPYSNNPTVQVHGPGWSKILIGEDFVDRWEDFIDVLFNSVVTNGGRSCINASAILAPSRGLEIAEALAEKLAQVRPLPREDKDARLAAFLNPEFAGSIDRSIDRDLQTPGAEDITARFRGGDRLVELEGSAYLLPTLVFCESFDHPLANREFLFPYVSVVEIPQDRMVDEIGPTLVATALTRDAVLVDRLLRCPLVDRLNLGPIPTTRVEWDQPHEGNLFEFLYRRRAIQKVF